MENTNPPTQSAEPTPNPEHAKSKTLVVLVVILAAIAAVLYFVFGSETPTPLPEPIVPPAAQENSAAADAAAVEADLSAENYNSLDSELTDMEKEMAQ